MLGERGGINFPSSKLLSVGSPFPSRPINCTFSKTVDDSVSFEQ